MRSTYAEMKADMSTYAEMKAERDRWRREALQCGGQIVDLWTQLVGGATNPVSCKEHPGHILLSLGWEYDGPENPGTCFNLEVAEESGCYWLDPEGRGTGEMKWYTLPGALSLALRRVLGEGPPRVNGPKKPLYERLLETDEGQR